MNGGPASGERPRHGLIQGLKGLVPRTLKARLKSLLITPDGEAQPPLEQLPNVPDLLKCYRSLASHPEVQRCPGGWRYKGGFYPDYITVGGSSSTIFRTALKYCTGHGIDVGAGLWPLPGAKPVDVWRGPGLGSAVSDFPDASLDFVFSSHCLEHIVQWQAALAEWTTKIRPGGMIFLYLPHPDCAIWHPNSPFVIDEHKWQPTFPVIEAELQRLGFQVIAADPGPDAMYSFFAAGKRPA